MHPGETLKHGKGHSRIYVSDNEYPRKTADMYHEAAIAAEATGQRFFGIKGISLINKFNKCPEQICIDPLHMVYEGSYKVITQ